ncbi:MAG: hypothetical protein LBG60_16165 [Bifidobacteriaceae bacterium]|nr:hypothetical protein [Bifidobacteriaceae bacterium]
MRADRPGRSGNNARGLVKVMVAVVAAAVMMGSGVTLALWQSGFDLSELGRITHGALKVTATGATTAYRLHQNGAVTTVAGEKGDLIDLTNYQASPGDRLELDLPIAIVAEGDNLKFDLLLRRNTDSGTNRLDGWVFTVQTWLGSQKLSETDLKDGVTWRDQPVAEDLAASDGQAEYKVVIIATFPADGVTGEERAGDSAYLKYLYVTAKQTL